MRRGDVAAALRQGHVRRSARLRISVRENALPLARVALVVAKRLLPRAVDRNRARRVIREAFRRNQEVLGGMDVVVRLDSPCADRPLEQGEIEALLRAARHA
jgi:ribonuclease P protein component